MRSGLCALCLLAALAAGAQQQEDEPAPAEPERQGPENEAPAPADKAAEKKDGADSARSGEVPEAFNPTEQVSEDLSTSFPVDI
jgi:hypothetical protein